MRDHRRLKVWQRARRLAGAIYRHSAMYPADEQFGLVRQMRRAAVSVAANIAEGAGRDTRRDYARFLTNATGSLSELETHLAIGADLGLGDARESGLIATEVAALRASVHALRASVLRDPN